MNALIITVSVLATSVTLSIVEATPVNLYRNPSPKCCTVEPTYGKVDQDSNEGCTCSGSWQPRCCCPNPQNCPTPRRYNSPECRSQQPTTCRLPSCSAPPIATTPIPYQIIQYSQWPTKSCPDLPYSTARPCPCPAPVAVPTVSPSCTPQQLPCPFCASQQLPSCQCGGSSLSVNSPFDEYVSSSSPCLTPPQLPLLPKFISVPLRPLSFNINRPSALCRPGLGVYGSLASSLVSSLGCDTPVPYNYK